MEAFLFPLEEAVQSVGPFANASDVQPDVVLLFGCATQRKRMPLVLGNGRDVYEHIIARTEAEVKWPLDDQMGDLGGQQQSGGDVRLAMLCSHPN